MTADLGIIVTGIVGLAGMGSTILATRMTARSQTANLRISLDAEAKRVKRDERRQVYSRCITALEIMSDALAVLQAAKLDLGNGQRDIASEFEAHSNFFAAAKKAKLAVAEVSLVGPEDVRSLASQYFMVIVDGREHGEDHGKAASSHVQMLMAMQAALDAPEPPEP